MSGPVGARLHPPTASDPPRSAHAPHPVFPEDPPASPPDLRPGRRGPCKQARAHSRRPSRATVGSRGAHRTAGPPRAGRRGGPRGHRGADADAVLHGAGLRVRATREAARCRASTMSSRGAAAWSGWAQRPCTSPLYADREYLFGRGGESHVVLPEASISRLHGLLSFSREGRWVFRDLSSRNGSYLSQGVAGSRRTAAASRCAGSRPSATRS